MSRFSPLVRPTNVISTSTIANWFGNQFVTLPGSFESIATVTGTGSESTLTINNIPGTYKHLQIRSIAAGASTNYALMRFNNDSASNYTSHFLYGNGSSITSSALTAQTSLYPFRAYSTTSSYFSSGVVDVLDYSDTNKNKTTRSITGDIENPLVMFISGLWVSTSAITRIDFVTQGGNFRSGTTFALYGIKGV